MRCAVRRCQIDAIACDVGDVLIRFDIAVPAAIEQAHGLPEGSVLFQTLKSPAGRLATLGQIGFDEWFRQVALALPEKAVNEWLAYHGELNQELLGLLTSVRDRCGVRLYFLTNAMSRLWRDLEYHGVRHIADEVFCSASIGMAKPDPRIYRHLIRLSGISPGRILYIEDTPEWAEAGRRAGLLSHTYVSNPGVIRELRRLEALP
jgi:putative hydrolase of the HAD superfamily